MENDSFTFSIARGLTAPIGSLPSEFAGELPPREIVDRCKPITQWQIAHGDAIAVLRFGGNHVPFKSYSARGVRARRVFNLLDGLVRQSRIHESDQEGLRLLPCRRAEDSQGVEGPWQVLSGAQESGRLPGEEVGLESGGMESAMMQT